MNSKPLLWIKGEVKSPPLSIEARRELGFLLREIQEGEILSLPHSRPMPAIGSGVHELRIHDSNGSWRLIYQIRTEGVLVLDVFKKKTVQTPHHVIENCRKRIQHYENVIL
ncbi:MAG: type II toxin-antitoxin system RelE/ParE family toxin [Verrucomicrobiota bacterium]